jgi:hypothetical protein
MSVFEQKAPAVMSALMKAFGLKDFQAAGPVGNLGRESGGFAELHEEGQAAGVGGYGWGQWTGPRRVNFLNWCKAKNLNWQSDEANQGYLIHDLSTSYKSVVTKLLHCTTLAQAVEAFEKYYEVAGVVAMADRLAWGERALKAYRAAHPAKPKPAPAADDDTALLKVVGAAALQDDNR